MKKTFSRYGLIGVMAALGLTSVTIGASAQSQKYEGREKVVTGVHKASDIIGMEVCNSQNDKLGKVEDLIVDWKTGRVPYAVLSSGGILGIGDKLIVVPSSRFTYVAGQKKLLLDADKIGLQEAPRTMFIALRLAGKETSSNIGGKRSMQQNGKNGRP